MPATTYHGPLNPDPKDGEASIIIFGYVPSLGLAISGIVLWSLVLAAQVWYSIRKRGYGSFHILLGVGSLMELGGYISRVYAHYHPFLVGTFVSQFFLIVVAPVLFSAGIYLSLLYAIRGYPGSEKILAIRQKLVLIFFITADVVCTVIQVVGAALIGTSESDVTQGHTPSVTPQTANNILTGGLAAQTFSFLCFLVILSIASWGANRPDFMLDSTSLAHRRRLRLFLWTILITADLILLRTVFRLAETAEGFFGVAATNEILYGCLESLPVILALLIWTALPPSRLVPQESDDSVVTTTGPGEKEKGGRLGRRSEAREEAALGAPAELDERVNTSDGAESQRPTL